MMHVVIVVPNGQINLGTVSGSLEVLRSANAYAKRMGRRSAMEISIAGTMTETKLSDDIFSIHPKKINEIQKPDLLIVPAVSYSARLEKENADLILWIKEQYANGSEVATMCSGAFLLACTGLLDGKKCSTHWAWATDFRQMFPRVNLLAGNLITDEDGIYTNGGAYSFLNLLLYLVEKYFDRETAVYCSKIFQIDMDRTSQLPFSIFQAQKNHKDELIIKAQIYIEENVNEKISFKELALAFAISRRNFDRRFLSATGNTPLQYQQRLKVEIAKNNLEKGKKTVSEIMYEVGYTDNKAFRELFKRMTGLSPLDYKAKFKPVSETIHVVS